MQLGIIVDDLGFSQESFMVLSQVANLCKSSKNSIVIFQKEIVPPYLIPMCSVMNISEIFSFKGVLITTTLENLRLAKNVAKMTKDIVYYPMDLEWLRKEKNFIDNYRLLNSTNIIVQNKFHLSAIQKYSNAQPIAMIENMNFNKIVGIYESNR